MMVICDPRAVPWDFWRSKMNELYANQNISQQTEENWREFANNLTGTAKIQRFGIPDHRAFADWRSWAEALVGILNKL